jgi:hypothetical protein
VDLDSEQWIKVKGSKTNKTNAIEETKSFSNNTLSLNTYEALSTYTEATPSPPAQLTCNNKTVAARTHNKK